MEIKRYVLAPIIIIIRRKQAKRNFKQVMQRPTALNKIKSRQRIRRSKWFQKKKGKIYVPCPFSSHSTFFFFFFCILLLQ